jgi:hypothetical protein
MDKVRNIAKVVQDYWLFITIAFAGFSGLVKVVHEYYMVPVVIDPMVREISYDLYSDSSDVWRDRWVNQMPGGFGGLIAEGFGMDKSDVVDSLARMYYNEKNKDISLVYLMDRMRYQVNFNTTIFLMCTESYLHNGIKMRKTATKESGKYDVYYQDGFDKWWKAIYYADEDAYYYIPDNSNGQRIKCD